ncbi:MAG: TIGR03936 family radical SAM-associated protein [Clostridia bacterium]|nr:TIGR03936 family radical SAM-associated protein [Clostridia bacterium]
MNLRIKFNKTKDAKYISHLDLLRTFNRMLMRSMLTPSYSQGFNPHILLNFLHPSSVGTETLNDCADIVIEGEYDTKEVLKNLREVSPLGIEICDVTTDDSLKFNTLCAAMYTVKIDTNKDKDEIINFLRQDEILIEKKTKKGIKEVDIKPLFLSYEVEDKIVLKLKLKAGSSENLNPQLVLKAMEKHIDNIKISNVRIVREYLISENGEIF